MKNWTDSQQCEIVVIGGGPAGMLAAATAAQRGYKVVLLEKNPFPGKKLNITGKGRCNLTNNCQVQDVLSNVPHNARFLYSAVTGFSPADAMAFFESQGVALKTERGNRVFPCSDKASDITGALQRYMSQSGVMLRRGRANRIAVSGGVVSGVETDGVMIHCEKVILATGGLSYPATGSTGDGYAMAEALGHTIVKPRPSLVPLIAKQPWCAAMQGLSLRNVSLRLMDESGRQVYGDFGELLFTHYGVSGPLILSASAMMADKEKHHYHILIDLKPALDEKKLDARILRDFGKYANRNFANALPDLLHRLMIPVIIELSGIPSDTQVNSITKQQRLRLLSLIKELRIDIAGLRPIEEAVVTSGGIKVGEINPKTMESKLVKSLYFAGEIIDVDAYTGGFNLQIAWSTGYCAGCAV